MGDTPWNIILGMGTVHWVWMSITSFLILPHGSAYVNGIEQYINTLPHYTSTPKLRVGWSYRSMYYNFAWM